MMRFWSVMVFLFFSCHLAIAETVRALDFENLTQEELVIDTVLPFYGKTIALSGNYTDSTYRAIIEYPEFEPLTKDETHRLLPIIKTQSTVAIGAMPEVETFISTERKQGRLSISFIPLVYRDGKYMKMISFRLSVISKAQHTTQKKLSAEPRYASHSILSSGKWVKIRVPSTGYYQISSADINQLGFSDISRVKVFGYGGAAQPDVLTDEYLRVTDDLKEVPTVDGGNKKVFFARGPICWDDKTGQRVFNQFSSYGYYFLTEGDDAQTITADEMKATYYPSDADYHTLYEKDEVAWFHGGRNLFENRLLTSTPTIYNISTSGHCSKGTVSVSITASTNSKATVVFNDSVKQTITLPSVANYAVATQNTLTFPVECIKSTNKISITNNSGCDMRLDYICINYDEPSPMPDLLSALPSPEYVAYIDNQDLHADSDIQMVIIVPESGKMDAAAERLKRAHEMKDGMRVKVVHDYELYHEFSSGTPDANAYRRYMKMLYDKAGTDESRMPRYLLLFGDCAWDNRMVSNDWKTCDRRDYLLCYESENSFSATTCYMMEDYFGLLDDGEGGEHTKADKPDIGIGRLCVTTAENAAVQVDKIISYMNNKHAGDWQNTICVIGDDGDSNRHVEQAEMVAKQTETLYPGYNIKRVYIEAYTRESSATGNSYPSVTRLLREQMTKGALFMNYSGHGTAYQMAHERVLLLSDFAENKTQNLPVWFTASCDIMPIDTKIENFGEVSMANPSGGAVAFIGTTRTVFEYENSKINQLFSKYVFMEEKGHRITLGEALRRAKNDLITTGQDLSHNKLHYVLLGDPAMSLATPTAEIVIDSINNAVADEQQHILPAGSTVTLVGHVKANRGDVDADFNGIVSVTVKDAEEYVLCHNYDTGDTEGRFGYYDRKNVIYNGNDNIRNGRFSIRFTVPMDIKYDSAEGLILLYAHDDSTRLAHGNYEHIVFKDAVSEGNDSIGPSIYCYLNSPAFKNGGKVNTTPYLVAQLADKDGINVSGSSIGHDLSLVIDGVSAYNLNDYFEFDFGSYTSGKVTYCLPELAEGKHKLQLKAWDVLNNSSTAELMFEVVNGLKPVITDIGCTISPAKTSTDFILIYDRAGSAVDVTFEVYDLQGRIVWRKTETGVTTDGRYLMHWDLTSNSGSSVTSGVYLYRARVSSGGSSEALMAKKLLVSTGLK
ncbi:MAG: type IX secretion system sortase PorU [Prevotella sp.]|nr:type IX secretion system sortase PorU [Candidatus Equicola faecalis]